jgi:RNA polymerase sigma factor (TIGR02999 family)
MPSGQITELLQKWSDGDTGALEELTPLLYSKLHAIARHHMRHERAGHTLQATALINEAYVRLIGWKEVRWQNRTQFFAVSAQLMRRVLVDFARARNYDKRGAGARPISLDEVPVISRNPAREIIAVDEALKALESIDPRKSQIVELRFFGGLTVEETAEVLKVSTRTILRDWDLAKAWLAREMKREKST